MEASFLVDIEMEAPFFVDIEPQILHDTKSKEKEEEEEEEDNDVLLPSFALLRQKTFDTLYNCSGDSDRGNATNTNDKSPKGSVDEPIRPLIQLLNFHPRYCTLSSCSGRIAVYDTELLASTKQHKCEYERIAQPNEESKGESKEESKEESHGKGTTGGWLLAAHEEINVQQVLEMVSMTQTNNSQSNTFSRSLSFEPMLLHVAAANLKAGQALLQVALQQGFRESGLIVTAERVTVAVRSHALAWNIPLPQNNTSFNYGKSYWTQVLHACNDRLQQNHHKMKRLYSAIRQSLFVQKNRKLNISASASLPRLNIWQHATVMVQQQQEEEGSNSSFVSLIVVGGYGTGPDNTPQTKCQRSNHVYQLQGHCQGCQLTVNNENHCQDCHDNDTDDTILWEDAWQTVPTKSLQSVTTNDNKINNDIVWQGISVLPATWTARQACTAGVLLPNTTIHNNQHLIVVFGGRQGPQQALGDLFLLCLDSNDGKGTWATPQHVQGQPPSPRWGHAMVATTMTLSSLSFEKQQDFVISGGRNATNVLHDVFVLSFCETGLVQWTTVTQCSIPRCWHAMTTTTHDENKHIWVWGGMQQLGFPLASSSSKDDTASGVCQSDLLAAAGSKAAETQTRIGMVEESDTMFRIGHTVTPGIVPARHEISATRQPHCIVLGGVSTANVQGDEADQIPVLESLSWTEPTANKSEVRRQERDATVFSNECLSWLQKSMLVHHCTVLLPSINSGRTRIAVVGGGVQGFAFGQVFSDSIVLQLEWVYGENDKTEHKKRLAKTTRRSDRIEVERKTATKPPKTNVFFVRKHKAKQVKTLLETEQFLDKQFRMAPVDPIHVQTLPEEATNYIAVPIVYAAVQLWDNRESLEKQPPWMEHVEGLGMQQVLWSSSMFAQPQKKPS